MFAALLLSLAPCQAPVKEPLPGRAMIDAYFARQVKQIAGNCLNDLTTKEDWERRRPELRRQFLEMMGLWPLPERTDLKATVTGTVEGEGFTVEKLHFQSKPGLYVTANVYTPNPKPPGKLPAILYVCGHGNIVENGISYGSKVSYQYHPAWFAKHGYVCIILDTLQLGEIKGEHHGTYKLNQWWWQSRGYTPGGVELWNAMRALDYLETRPDVDMKKIGVTGRSGGGATSWWVAAADDRPAAIAPIAGIADLESHVCKGYTERLKAGVIAGHCDCMYMVNTYRWDFAMVAALAAPRPLLLGNSDADDIFPVPGYRSIAAKVGKVYDLYGKREYFDLLETKGPHKDTPELRIGINRFMNKWLKGDTTTKVEDDLPPKLPASALKVLKEMPKDVINDRIAETFVPAVKPAEIPNDKTEAKAWWEKERVRLKGEIRKKCFAGWPKEMSSTKLTLHSEDEIGPWRLRSFDYEPNPGYKLRMLHFSQKGQQSEQTIFHVGDEQIYNFWCDNLRSNLGTKVFGRKIEGKPGRPITFEHGSTKPGDAIVIVFPRGVGPTRWADIGSTDETHIRRRFALLGQTLDGERVRDVLVAIRAIDANKELNTKFVHVHGLGEMIPVAMAAALFEPRITEVKLSASSLKYELLPFLNASKWIDLPRFFAMLIPQNVSTVGPLREENEWESIITFADRVGIKRPEIHGK